MNFVIQTFNKTIKDVEQFNLINELNRQKYLHTYKLMDLKELESSKDSSKDCVPVGNLDYVGAWLKMHYNIINMYPIEVPNCLRIDKFLKRKYSIIEGKDIPTNGRYFLKNATKLKDFSYNGDLGLFMYDGIFDKSKSTCDTSLKLDKNDLFQLSEIIPIVSEYRVIVINDVIQSIQYYDGDCTVFPDVEFIKNMVGAYKCDDCRPKAYTIDVAVTSNRGTTILELHAAVSFGTYGFTGEYLPNMYKQGLDYYINHNKKVDMFSNFK